MAHIQIDTYGWDTQYLMTFNKVNEAIARNNVSPTEFNAHQSAPNSQLVNYELKGTWGTWEMSLDHGGGGGQLVMLKCPVKSGNSIHYQYDSQGERSTLSDLDISGGNVWVQIQLAWVKESQTIEDSTAENGTGTQKKLVIKNEVVINGKTVPAVSILGTDFADLDSVKAITNPLEKVSAPAIAETMLGDWINQNVAEFKHVFAQLLVNEIADQADWQWLKPTDVEYAIAADTKTNDLSKSIFAVNCMVNHHSSVRNYNEVDQRILGLMDKSDSVFVISPAMFCQHILLKGCLAIQLGTTEEDWVFDNDNRGISNKHDLKVGSMPDGHGQTAQATVTKGNMRLQLRDENIYLEVDNIAWAWDSGHNVTATYKAYFKPVLKSGTDASGKPYINKFDVEQDGDETLKIGVNKTASEITQEVWIDIAWGAFGGLLGAGLGAALEKAFSAAAARIFARAAARGVEEVEMEVTFRSFGESLAALGADLDEEGIDALNRAMVAANREAAQSAAQNAARLVEEGSAGFINSLRTGATNLTKFVLTSKWSIVGAIMGTVVGEVLSNLGHFTNTKVEDQLTELPTLDNLLSQCLNAIHWPDQKPGTEGFQIQQVLLEDAFLIGGTLVTKEDV